MMTWRGFHREGWDSISSSRGGSLRDGGGEVHASPSCGASGSPPVVTAADNLQEPAEAARALPDSPEAVGFTPCYPVGLRRFLDEPELLVV